MKNELYEKIYTEALQNKELLVDAFNFFGYMQDTKISSKKRIFFKAYADQKTGSINLYQRDGNWLFKDFFSDEAGNIFNLLKKHGVQEKNMMNFLIANFPHHFSLSKNEIDSLLEKSEKKDYYVQRFSSMAFKAKKKKQMKNIKESTLPKILISKPTVAKNFQHLDMYNKQLAKYMKENRGLTEFNNLPVTKLVLIDRQTEKVKGYNSAVVVPFGIYDYSIFEKSEEELKDLIYRNGAELRLSEKIEDLKSYTKIGYDENGERKSKTSTMFINEDSTNLAVFESVFDYIAMQPVINHETTDILIMNGASMVLSLAEMLKEANFKKEYQFALFFQQNDIASYKMVENLLTNEEISDYLQFGEHFITLYKKNEEKKDINDLVKDGIPPEDIVKRLTKIKPEALREKIDSEKKNIENENIPKPKPKGI